MIALDTSALIAFFHGDSARAADQVDRALAGRQALLPPVVLTEILSAPGLDPAVMRLLSDLPTLALTEGYWERAASTRRTVLAKRLRARLADTLIAQSCIDHEVPLLTLDSDFRYFARLTGLVLAG